MESEDIQNPGLAWHIIELQIEADRCATASRELRDLDMPAPAIHTQRRAAWFYAEARCLLGIEE